MRNRLVRGIAAAAAALAVALPVAAQPAQAEPEGDGRNYFEVAVDLLKSLWGKRSDGSIDPAEWVELVTDVKNAIAGVETDVVALLEAWRIADLKAKTEGVLTSVVYLSNPRTAQLYHAQVYEAAFMAKGYLDGPILSEEATDAIGKAYVTNWTLLIYTEERVGLLTAARYATYKEGLQKIIDKIEPDCGETGTHAGQIVRDCSYGNVQERVVEQAGPNGWEHSYNGGPWTPGAGPSMGDLRERVRGLTAEGPAIAAKAELEKMGY